MASVTSSNSPLHEKMCVAGTAIVGGAIGRPAGLPGILVLGAVGAIVGLYVCSRDKISKPMGSWLDFDAAIKDLSINADAQSNLVRALVERGYAEDQRSAAVMVKYAIAETQKDSRKVYDALPNTLMPPTGRTAHGLDHLSRKAGGAVASAT